MGKLFVLVALLVLAPVSAGAQACITWDDAPSRGGTSNRQFSCNTDAGSNTFVITAAPVVDILGITTIEATVYVTGGPLGSRGPIDSLSAWWHLNPGGCRPHALTGSADFNDEPWVSSPVENAWGGMPQFAMTPFVVEPFIQSYASGVWGHFTLQMFVPQPIDLLAGHEYYLARGTISNTGTLSGNCANCCQQMLLSCKLLVAKADDPELREYVIGQSCSDATWNAYNSTCGVTAASTTTWGTLKTRYR